MKIADFIAKSLSVLRDECPEAYFLMCALLAPCEVLLRIDGEPVSLAFDAAGVHLLPAPGRPRVELATTRATILDVLDARQTLHEAVVADAILLKGAPSDLAACHDALLTYVRGAVRCPSFPVLLDEFRQWSEN